MMKAILLACFIFCLTLPSFGQDQSLRKELGATRVDVAPAVDGKLDDAIWDKVPVVTDFVQERPNALQPSKLKSEVKVVYDDQALYVGAMLYDEQSSIARMLTQRDNLGNADVFAVVIDPYKSGINGYGFLTTAAGVQFDMTINDNGDNNNWDAVWESEVQLVEGGWSIEVRIPYSALRFANAPVQSWYVNFGRVSNNTGEMSWWNPIDRSKNGFFTQAGILSNLKDLKPPVRLFAFPYLSAAVSRDEDGNVGTIYNGGMDLKYGINDAFTLDMTLVPDFGQVQSDNQVLNLGPFEVRYDENRQFFTEGTELFNKEDLFYSRRVGQSFGKAAGDLQENEEYSVEPQEAPLLNATKISGRNSKGLGIGFFNALTNETKATIENVETGEKREMLYDPLTNFNVFVLDQNLKNNSNIAFVNTNVTRWGDADDGNVSALRFSLNNKTNDYNISGYSSLSQIMGRTEEGAFDNTVGYRYYLRAGKVSGKYQFQFSRNVESDNYNPNDMGYLGSPNELTHGFWFGYVLNQPKVKWLNRFRYNLSVNHTQLYKPREFDSFGIWSNINGQFSNFWNFSMGIGLRPTEGQNHFEAQWENRRLIQPESFNMNLWIGSDERKMFTIQGYAGFFSRWEWNQNDYWYGVNPRLRVGQKLTLSHDLSFNIEQNDRGFVTHELDENDELQRIIFGIRDVQTFTNTFSGSYTFNNRMGLTLRVRHYWSKVPYLDDFYELNEEGYLLPSDFVGVDADGNNEYNVNFNAFNIDMVYRWRFAPGSEISVVWKNSIYRDSDNVGVDFFNNLHHTIMPPVEEGGTSGARFPLAKSNNTLSVKILYFLDYQSVRGLF